jgi:hypothetical protein
MVLSFETDSSVDTTTVQLMVLTFKTDLSVDTTTVQLLMVLTFEVDPELAVLTLR